MGSPFSEQIFDAGRENLLSIRGDNQLFLAAGYVVVSVGIDLADIAGGKPTIAAEHRPRRFLIVVVADEDSWGFYDQLTVIGKLRLDVWQ